eukprot:TRINITY_DN783_c0_g1_i1.p1 TRINITY_DN783_c0_g1~~TRINITY_DN783_c0_g1_i1.p1  ORF type:complete len:167 (-),score=56.22 TRINITY_DN783_c0_g1_i1:10-510(-)
MVMGSYCVHYLEAPGSAIMELLHELNEEEPYFLPKVLSNIKIVVHTEDIDDRSFTLWANRVIQGVSTDAYYEDVERNLSEAMGNMYIGLKKLGLKLSMHHKNEWKAILDSAKMQMPELLPSHELLERILEDEDVMDVPTFLSMATEVVDIDLEGERVWPISSQNFH